MFGKGAVLCLFCKDLVTEIVKIKCVYSIRKNYFVAQNINIFLK